MKAIAGLCGLATLLLVTQADSGPSVPAAEGFGADTAGGRSGRAIRVTTLADAGPGSLRRHPSAPRRGRCPLVREVEPRSGRIIDSQKEVGGWPQYGGTDKIPGGRDRR